MKGFLYFEDQPSWRLWRLQHHQGEDHGPNAIGHRQHLPVEKVAEAEGEDNAQKSKELDEAAKETSHVDGRDLHDVDGRGGDLEAEADASEEPADVEHPDVGGEENEEVAEEKVGAGDEPKHLLSPDFLHDESGDETAHKSTQSENGS